MRPLRKTSSKISLDTALQFFNDDETLFTCILGSQRGFARGLPQKKDLQENPDVAKLFREVLAFGRSEDEPELNPQLRACYRRGWFQAELANDMISPLSDEPKTVYVFPSMIHQR